MTLITDELDDDVYIWADPGSTATPGQPAVEQEQAPNFHQLLQKLV